MDSYDFQQITGLNTRVLGAGAMVDHLPCFAHRWAVSNRVNTPELIEAYIQLASKKDYNDVLVFSVTEQDNIAWPVWMQYAKDNPRVFKVIEGGSIHGVYQCRMYIYTKPAKERKFHADNANNWFPR